MSWLIKVKIIFWFCVIYIFLLYQIWNWMRYFLHFCTCQQKLKNWSFANFFFTFFLSLLGLCCIYWRKIIYTSVIIFLLFLIPISRIKKKKTNSQTIINQIEKNNFSKFNWKCFETILDKSVDARPIRIL